MKILVIEDDEAVANMVKIGLMADSCVVELAANGADGSFLARSYDYDAIILDYSLPKKDGIIVCREIRSAGKNTPIIFLSINDDTSLKVSALNFGADDYLTKPFSMDELRARIKALARRAPVISESRIVIDDLVLDVNKQSLYRNEKLILLTRKEYALMEYLMKNAGVVVSRAMILDHVWSAESDPFSNTVEAHVRNIRKKLLVEGKHDPILNIPGRGYVVDTYENLRKFGNF